MDRIDMSKVTIELYRRDLAWLAWHMGIRSKFIWAIGGILWAAVMWSAKSGEKRPHDFAFWIIMALSVTVIWILFVAGCAAVGCLPAFFSKNVRGVVGIHHYSIEDAGMRESTEMNDSFTNWQAVYATKLTPRYFLIFQSPGFVHMIPRRAFAGILDYEQFAATVQDKVAASKG